MQKAHQIHNISFIGSGNVATHLAVAFRNAGLNISEVYSATAKHAIQFAELTGSKFVSQITDLDQDVDLCLICVPDAKVKAVFEQLPTLNGIVAHTSGITSIDVLTEAMNYGVFYPLQTFSKNKEISLLDVPFCIEGSSFQISDKLTNLAKRLSQNVRYINSEERKYLHLTAVMVNNFTNHLYHIAEDILVSKEIDFDLLLPLIKETAHKIEHLEPSRAQTGPAKRNDQSTIDLHTEMLEDMPEYIDLYRLISEQINKKYHG